MQGEMAIWEETCVPVTLRVQWRDRQAQTYMDPGLQERSFQTHKGKEKNNKTVFRITNPKMKLLSGSNGSLKISIMNVPNEKKKEEISSPPKIKLLGHRRYLLCL